MTEPILALIAYSPWSHKARWAVDHARIPCRIMPFTPLLSVPRARLMTRRVRGPITAPLWIEGGEVLMDSFAIARYVDSKGEGPSLFPAGRGADIDTWNRQSERCLAAGRALTTASVAADPVALRESVPAPLHAVGPLADLVGRYGVRYLQRKYRFSPTQRASHEATLRDGLAALERALATAQGPYLLGDRLSYADVTMAVVLHFVDPPPALPLGPASRPHWTRPELAAAFPRAIAWRDALLATHGPTLNAV